MTFLDFYTEGGANLVQLIILIMLVVIEDHINKMALNAHQGTDT